jgi:hypothetical protein
VPLWVRAFGRWQRGTHRPSADSRRRYGQDRVARSTGSIHSLYNSKAGGSGSGSGVGSGWDHGYGDIHGGLDRQDSYGSAEKVALVL